MRHRGLATRRGLVGALMLAVALVAAPTHGAAAEDAADPAATITDTEASTRILDLETTTRILDLERRISSLDGTQVSIESPDAVSIVLATDVLFAFNKATLSATAKAALQDAAKQVDAKAGEDGGTVVVTGHTDGKGEPAYNLALSNRRAAAVLAALRPLVTAGDLAFKPVGVGERQPLVPETKADGSDDPKARARNRRVEIRFAR